MERVTGYGWIFLIKRTSHAPLLIEAVQHVRRCMLRMVYTLASVRTDAGRIQGAVALTNSMAEHKVTINAAAREA